VAEGFSNGTRRWTWGSPALARVPTSLDSGCYDPGMQTEQIVALLVAERNRLDTAIQALQGRVKRLGRLFSHDCRSQW
jgi:hypothetical protein